MLPLTAAIPRALAALLRDAPLSPGKVEFAWNASVGPALHRSTAVRLEQGVLLVDAQTAPWANEVRRSSKIILRRMQGLLGDDVIMEIVVRA
jgi:predicted nucleic acid-binding Zn ribbon protein